MTYYDPQDGVRADGQLPKMQIIGLIGGMSWESTAVYYRLINTSVRERLGKLHSAEILLRSVDFDQIITLQKASQWEEAGAYLGKIAEMLTQAGAGPLLICTNTMHLVADHVQARSGGRLIHIIDETARAVLLEGCRLPLVLATSYTMEHGFYADRMAANGLAVLMPEPADRTTVHNIIFDELCRGIVNPASRFKLLEVIARGLAAGADSVILGCTEICMILDPKALGFPCFDSTAIHAEAAVTRALSV